MAREFAQIRLTTWADHDATALTLEQQGMYWMLIAQPAINLAGVLDYLPGRLARLAGGLTTTKVNKLVGELQDRAFVFLDPDTDELLVRSVIRTSGAWKSPTAAKSIATNVEQTLSPRLKSVLLTELQRVCREATEAGQWEKATTHLQGAADALTRAGIHPWDRGTGYPNAYPNARGMGGEGEGEGTGGEGDGDGANAPTAPNAFDQWWTHWPKKTSRGDAKKAFPKALRAAGLTALIDGAQRYAAWVERNRVEDRFIVGPGRWLREERWDDDLTDRAPDTPAVDRQAQILIADRQRRLASTSQGGNPWQIEA